VPDLLTIVIRSITVALLPGRYLVVTQGLPVAAGIINVHGELFWL